MYIFIYFTLLVSSNMTRTNFTKNYKIGRAAPSLSGLSWSLGPEAKPLAGVQGAEFREAPRFKPYFYMV